MSCLQWNDHTLPGRGLSLLRIGLVALLVACIFITCPIAHATGPTNVHLEIHPTNVSNSPQISRSPSIAVDSHGIIHIAWEEGIPSQIYYSYNAGSGWAVPQRVTTGEQPAIAVDPRDVVHLVFVNEIFGNYNVRYVRRTDSGWTIPVIVASTSGISSAPDLAAGDGGMLYAVWTDNTPGYNVIYYAEYSGTIWMNWYPIPSARGSVPAVFYRQGIVHVVWQDRDTPADPYEIYYTQKGKSGWTVPENLSDTPSQQSIIADLAVDSSGRAHVGWQEQLSGIYNIYYTRGTPGRWTAPENISGSTSDAALPAITADAEEDIHVVWDESVWLKYRHFSAPVASWGPVVGLWGTEGIADATIALGRDQVPRVAWAQRDPGGDWEVYESPLAYWLWMPQVFCTR